MNMTDEQKNRLEDLKARQLAGEHLPCPRCGRDTMDVELMHNALSRHTDVMLCSSCGMYEGLEAMKGIVKPLTEWACFTPPAPSELPSASELISRVMTEQIQYLTTLYERWLDEHEYEDFKAYQEAAKHRCPGLTELRQNPFLALYQAGDGRLAVRFENDGESTKVSAEIIP